MQEEISQIVDESSGTIYPIKFVKVGELSAVPAPIVRLSTCGGMTIEVLQEVVSTDPPQGCYVVVTPQQRRQGSATGLNLLSALVSLPGHYAAKSWLMERLSRSKSEEDEDETWSGMVRVDNIVTLLRGLLCPPGIAGEKELRKVLVSYVPNHFESGPGYQLAGESFIWLDVDVIEASVKEACLLEQQRQNALLCWERASELAARGGYLLDERYSDWAESKRREVEGYQRQAVHALHRLYLARDDRAGEEQVLLLLRSYWQTHPTDEDVLRPLLELLGKRGCVQEAEEYYTHLCQELEVEGRTPHPQTQRMIQQVRDGQSTTLYTGETTSALNAKAARISSFQDEAVSPDPPQRQDVLSLFSAAISESIMMAVHELERINMDTTRRDFLQLLGTSFVMARSGDEFQPFVRTMLTGDQMALLETEVATRWNVYHSGNTLQADEGFSLWLAEIERFAKALPLSRSQNTRAYSLVSSSYQLQGSIFRDKMEYKNAHTFYKKAFLAADEFDNGEMKSSSLARRGVTFIQQQKPIEAIQYLESALPSIDDLDFPYLKGYIFQALSEAYAMVQQKDQSQKNIDLAEQVLAQGNQNGESSNCQLNTTSIIAQKGVNSVLLQDYAHALDLLNRGLNTYASFLLRGRARLIAQKAEASYGLGYIEESTSDAKDALQIAFSIGSQKTIARIKNLHTSLAHSPYGKESSVAQLGSMLATN